MIHWNKLFTSRRSSKTSESSTFTIFTVPATVIYCTQNSPLHDIPVNRRGADVSQFKTVKFSCVREFTGSKVMLAINDVSNLF